MAINNDQTVSIEYEVRAGENLIDSNVGKEPLSFVYGSGQIIPGLESRISDMNTGEEAEIQVPAAEAYGEYNEDAIQAMPKEQLKDIEGLHEGMPLQGQGADGNMIQVIVKEIRDEDVLLDFNHPLAGQDLTFNIKVLEVK